ncbi:MAG: hypothetical protein ACRCTW_11635, partial [Lactococcus garvieae]
MQYTTFGLILLTVMSVLILVMSGIKAGSRIPLLKWAIGINRLGVVDEIRAINDKLQIDNFNLSDREKSLLMNLVIVCNMRAVTLFSQCSTFGRFRLWNIYENMAQVIQSSIIIFNNPNIADVGSGRVFMRELKEYTQAVTIGLTWVQSRFIAILAIEIIALILLSV